MKEKGLMAALIGEVFGTFILILLGDGVVANVGLAPRLNAERITGTPSPLAGRSQLLWQSMYRRVSPALT